MKKEKQVKAVSFENAADGIQTLLREGMGLAKCRECGCMKDALDNISASLRSPRMGSSFGLRKNIELWLKKMQPPEYS